MLSLLPLTLLIVRATAQGKCNHDIDYNCVDAYGVASFEFQPLFSTAPKFGYSFRVIQPGEPNNYGLEAPTVQTGPQMDMNVCLEYEGEMNVTKTPIGRVLLPRYSPTRRALSAARTTVARGC